MIRTLRLPGPVATADLFPELLENLLDLLKGLEDEDWSKPTACPGWSVKDVALHLLGGELGYLSSRRDGEAIHVASGNWHDLVNGINEWNRKWIDAARRVSAPLLIDLLGLAGGQVVVYMNSLDPDSVGAPVSWVGPEPAPVWLDMAREYTERWHHQQHMRDAVGKPGLKEPRYLAPVLATFAHALPRAFRHTAAAENTVVTLTIVGESGGQWSLRREWGIWKFYEGTSDQPEAEVTLDQEIAWRLFTRGIEGGTASELLAFKGDQSLGAPILDMVSILA